MSYVENTYICLAAPLLLAVLMLKRDWKKALIFLLAGMTSCLLSAYVTTFCAALLRVDALTASYHLAPTVEEIMKFLPLLFYLAVFRPDRKSTVNSAVLVAVGFATFENVCYLTSNGTSELVKLLIRGFGTGAMHLLCGMLVSVGMFLLWEHKWLRNVGTFAVLCSTVTLHAIFNIMVSEPGLSTWIGSAVPMVLIGCILMITVKKDIFKDKDLKESDT
ncbi:MAG: PrsW family intramembrane metalloprotease [Lachnospiraceae bacterium]|nr:PrsW family intramembrane metalloprotease [Lachnospiraceae bacterium]